jgi:hypothetical protein
VAVKGDLHESVECIPQSMGKGGSQAPVPIKAHADRAGCFDFLNHHFRNHLPTHTASSTLIRHYRRYGGPDTFTLPHHRLPFYDLFL